MISFKADGEIGCGSTRVTARVVATLVEVAKSFGSGKAADGKIALGSVSDA